jgi:radical SAM superfamily enzyme YgiQ (UPF0313 family)
MDLLLLTSVDPFSYQIIPDLGLMYLAASVRKAGHSVAILDCRKEGMDYDGLAEYVREARPEVVGIKSYTNEAVRIGRMAESIRRAQPGAVIITGGPLPTLDPRGALSNMEAVDFAFVGEAESSLPLFMDWVKDGRRGAVPEEIHGIAFRNDSGVTARESRLEEDLDKLPPPAWDLMPPDSYADETFGLFVPAFPTAPLLLSRGCPFQCAYCGARYISGNRMRYRSVENVLEDIDFLQREYGTRTFTFADDCFTTDRERAAAFFEALIRRPRKILFTFPNGVRAGSLDEELLKLMERAGCRLLGLGIESGSDQTLARMKKGQTTSLIREKVDLIRGSTSMLITGSFILGYPGETLADVKQTIKFAVDLPIHHAQICIFIPIPGTPVYDELVEQGTIRPEDWDPEQLTIDRASASL